MRDIDRFRGCLLGGAAGDALGYAVEFDSIGQIRSRYGTPGIREYELSGGQARFSDDTQMTLFTANGLLLAATKGSTDYARFIGIAYRDWYETQCRTSPHAGRHCWIAAIPELNVRRAPGGTCLSALQRRELGTPETRINDSKGCGGVMRVAPVGLFFEEDTPAATVQRVGAESAALTHGHELGWLPCAVLAQMVHALVQGKCATVEAAAREAMATLPGVFPQAGEVGTLLRLLERALALSRQAGDDLALLQELGEGWVGEEALAIALFCAARYEDDFDSALVASVNHSGDSDSTGAICGNILGAKLGLRGIPEKYLQKLECRELLTEIADDLCRWPQEVAARPLAEAWKRKYAFADRV